MVFSKVFLLLQKEGFQCFPGALLAGMVIPWEASLKKKKRGEGGKNQLFGQICWEVLHASLRLIIILA